MSEVHEPPADSGSSQDPRGRRIPVTAAIRLVVAGGLGLVVSALSHDTTLGITVGVAMLDVMRDIEVG